MVKLFRLDIYRLYPGAAQAATLADMLALHCRTYNALLEEHQRRYTANEPSYSFAAMCRDLTQWRGRVSALDDLSAQALQVTAKRVALAFQAFFRRTAAGDDEPGFPRFKPLTRFAGWGYKTHGDGWRLFPAAPKNAQGSARQRASANGHVRLSGVDGLVELRGRGRFEGTPKTAEVQHKAGKWYLSVTFDVTADAVARKRGTEAGAFDWGLTTLLTTAKDDGSLETIDNPRWLKSRLAAIKALQQGISAEEARIRAARGLADDAVIAPAQFSAGLKRLYAQLRALHGKIACQRHDFYHKLTAWLIGMLKTKAAEAASEFALANTRSLKPTQRCHACGNVVKKALSERAHSCACGAECGRDENAAKTILRWLLEGDSWFTPGIGVAGTKGKAASPLETPPLAVG